MDDNELRAPFVIDGRYTLDRELGRGGMGQVFAGRDLRLSRAVAVKVLRRGLDRPEAVARFSREARAASSLAHPNVVAVHDAGVADGRPYLVTEILHGETLAARLARGALPWPEAAQLALQLARGLSAAHQRGIVHRDLKPENVFITVEGSLKILDFGIARMAGEDQAGTVSQDEDASAGQAPVTAAGAFVGTVGYAAPEQVRGKPVDARTDLFSFGAVLYEMLSGARAFRRDSAAATSMAVLHDEPSPLPAGVPQALRELVARCLQKNPDARPASAGELVRALEARSKGSRKWMAWAATAAAVAALAATFVLRPRPGASLQTAIERRRFALAEQGTQSQPALRAFKEAEAAVAAGDDWRALESYRAAVAADPQFGLAWARLAAAARHGEPGLARDAVRGALKAAKALEPREQTLLEAQTAAAEGRVPRALQLYRSLTAERPDDVEAWSNLGQVLFEYAPLYGWPATDGADALRRALVLAPYDVESLRSLIDVAQLEGQPAVVRALTDRYLGSRAPLDVRWARAWASADERGRRSAIDEAVSSGALDVQERVFLRAATGDPALGDAEALASRLAVAGAPQRAFWLGALAIIELARGRPGAARVRLAEAGVPKVGGSLANFAAWLETLDFVHPTAAQLSTAVAAASRMDPKRVPDFALMRPYLEGALAVRAGNAGEAERAAAQLDATPSADGTSGAHDLALAVRARVRAAAGDRAGALALLEQQRLVIGEYDVNFFLRAPEQRLRSALLEASGRAAEAERWEVIGFDSPLEVPMAAPMHLHLCELALARHDSAAAAAHARTTLSAWSNAEPELSAELSRARRCLDAATSSSVSAAR